MTKSKLQIRIINVETGEEIVRDATAEEIAQMEIDVVNAKATEEAIKAEAIKRQAILDRLGLTADEAKLILG